MSARGKPLRLTHPAGECLNNTIGAVSKSALLDLVGDLLDLVHGEQAWDGSDAASLLAPRLRVRGDKVPRTISAAIIEGTREVLADHRGMGELL